MINTFADKETESHYRTGRSKKLSPDIIKRAIRKLDRLHTVEDVGDLRNPPGNRLHELSGEREGQYSISINDQWRICFRFSEGSAYDVEICDYHEEVKMMSIKNDKTLERRPTHPGEMLREEYMPDHNLSVSELARRIGMSRQSVNELIHERRSLSTEMAVRLARLFDDSAESWLNLQRNYDLWTVENDLRDDLANIQHLAV